MLIHLQHWMGVKFFKFFMKKTMSQRWKLSTSHHPCWRQEEQIPSGTPKLVRPWNFTSLFLEVTNFIPCAWQQWLSKPRAERCWVVFELVSKCVWGSCSGGWVSHWWLCWYCSLVVTEGSECQELAGNLSHCHCLSHSLESWRPELLRSWFLLEPCVSEGTAPELQPFGVLGGFLFSCWQYSGSSSSLEDSDLQDCSWTLNSKPVLLQPARKITCGHICTFAFVDDLEASAVKGWGQAWSGSHWNQGSRI